MARQEFEYESLQDVASIIGYLKAVTDGLERGHLSLASNGRNLELEPRGLLQLSVEAKRGKRRAQLIIKMAWREDRPEDAAVIDPLKIMPGSTPPAQP